MRKENAGRREIQNIRKSLGRLRPRFDDIVLECGSLMVFDCFGRGRIGNVNVD